MPLVVSAIGATATLAVILVSALMNWHYGTSRGVTDVERLTLGCLSVAVDVYKAVGLFFVAWSWQNRRWIATALACVAWLISVAVGLTSAVGFVATSRAGSISVARVDGLTQTSLLSDLQRKEARRATLGEVAAPRTLEVALETLRADPRFSASTGCSALRRRDLSRYCEQVQEATRAVEVGREADTLDHEVARLRVAISANKSATDAVADPQGDALARLLGFDLGQVSLGMSLLLALTAELFSCCGLYLSLSHGERLAWRSSAPAKYLIGDGEGESGVTRFATECTRDAPGAKADVPAIFVAYCSWCESRGRRPVATTMFFAEWDALCREIGWSIKRGVLRDVELVSAAADRDAA